MTMSKEQKKLEKEKNKLKNETLEKQEKILDAQILQENDNIPSIENKNEVADNVDNTSQVLDSEIDLDKAIIEERLAEAQKTQSKKKKFRSKIINTIFLLVNILLMVFIVKGFLDSLGEDINGMGERLSAQGNKLWWLAVGVLLYIVFIVTETLVFISLMKGTTGKRRPYLSYRVALTGKYYDNITPFAIGGQPFQIVTLAQDGLNPGIATSLPIIKLIIYNLVYTFTILLCFIFGMPLVTAGLGGLNRFLMILLIAVGVLGLIFTAFTSVLFILIGNGKIIGRGMARWLVKLGYALRIVKNYRKSYNKIMMQVREYQNSMDFLKKNKSVMVKCVIYSIIECISYFAIAVVCIYAFTTNQEFTFTFFFETLTKFLICQMAAAIIPLPGGTGMLEVGFILAFGSTTMLGDNVFLALLAFRIISYYLLLLHGFVQTVIDSAVRSVKLRKQSKEEQLLQN